MQRPRKSLVGGALAVLAVAGAFVAPAATGAGQEPVVSPDYDAAAIAWKDCPQGDGVAQCATIDVPLDWSKPKGAKTRIGIARRPATNPAKRIGVLMMNPGGPGASSVAEVASGSSFTQAVNERFDIVGFDPRGVNTSERVLCDEALSQRAEEAWPPEDKAGFGKLVSLNRKLMASCREHSGELVDHVDTPHNVRDMDAVRAALGEKKLNYLGYSYGSLLGQQYAEKFPHRVRAMVNDANLDHSVESTLDFMRELTGSFERNFLAFAKWCDTTPACALHGQNTAKVYREIREKVKRGEINYPGADEPADIDYLNGQLYLDMSWPPAWDATAEWLVGLREGTSEVRTMDKPVNDRAPLWCSDWRFPIKNYDEYKALRGTLAREFPNVEWSPQLALISGCVGDPLKTTNPQRPPKIEGAPPLVMIGTRQDMKTPYEWSRTAAEQTGSHLITYEGAGHTAYGTVPDSPRSKCVNNAVDAYLIDLKVPEDGLSCPALEKPPA